jgi:hypothetical protein
MIRKCLVDGVHGFNRAHDDALEGVAAVIPESGDSGCLARDWRA